MLHELIVTKLVNYLCGQAKRSTYLLRNFIIFDINQEVLIYTIKQTNLFYSKQGLSKEFCFFTFDKTFILDDVHRIIIYF
jgi:hypothetical protein